MVKDVVQLTAYRAIQLGHSLTHQGGEYWQAVAIVCIDVASSNKLSQKLFYQLYSVGNLRLFQSHHAFL